MTTANPAPESGTKAQAFIARKGALVMKEFHPISTIESIYDGEMEIATLVILFAVICLIFFVILLFSDADMPLMFLERFGKPLSMLDALI